MKTSQLRQIIREEIQKELKELTSFSQALKRDLSAPSSPQHKAYIKKMQAAREGNYSVGVPVKLKTGEIGLISFVKPNSLEIETVTGETIIVPKDRVSELISKGEYLRLRKANI